MLKSVSITILSLALLTPAAAQAGDIVDVAAGNPDFSTLVAAVQAAELVDALKAPGPLTVFAPTNDAFAALPKGTVDKLLEPANKDLLTELLTFHVASGEVMSGQVVELKTVPTLQGESLKVNVNGKGVRINNANVTAVDIDADNGVIHVVDKVLVPKGFLGKLNKR